MITTLSNPMRQFFIANQDHWLDRKEIQWCVSVVDASKSIIHFNNVVCAKFKVEWQASKWPSEFAKRLSIFVDNFHNQMSSELRIPSIGCRWNAKIRILLNENCQILSGTSSFIHHLDVSEIFLSQTQRKEEEKKKTNRIELNWTKKKNCLAVAVCVSACLCVCACLSREKFCVVHVCVCGAVCDVCVCAHCESTKILTTDELSPEIRVRSALVVDVLVPACDDCDQRSMITNVRWHISFSLASTSARKF